LSGLHMLANSPVVVNALVESLRHDPFYVAITEGHGADETRRSQALSRYFDYSMSEGARVGRCVQSLGDAPAAAVWLLPLSPERAAAEASAKAAFIQSALAPTGADNYHRIVEFMASRSRSIVSSAAWYLSIVGVAPGAQGQGVGGRLIRMTLAEADQAGAPSFLETFSQRNVSLYERLGFSVLASYEEPITKSRYWIMQRAPL
jgi:ribosomal protein S18 acetylase RimI-like enzyme